MKEIQPTCSRAALSAVVLIALICSAASSSIQAHIVPAENLHPVAESYRRLGFLLRLNPVPWDAASTDLIEIGGSLSRLDPVQGEKYAKRVRELISPFVAGPAEVGEPLDAALRIETAARLFELSTRSVAEILNSHLRVARASLDDHAAASRALEEARLVWAAFEPVVWAADPESFRRIGECWLELSTALGAPGLLGVKATPPDGMTFAEEADEIIGYVESNFGDRFVVSKLEGLAPFPAASSTALVNASEPPRLPPGADINKQLPRPRQVLNMAAKGVDEAETTLIALGDMAFDSPFIFGEPARSLGISCNTCHNKSITNPGFFVPGLSARPGGVDVSNSFFAPHANNSVFDPLDIPDLRGIRFTAPYGRNGRFDSLREFSRNVIVNEFNGDEPDPLLMDGLIAYMLEFDFLSNPAVARDGALTDSASAAAKRGEEIFNREYPSMGGRSCATCHVPSDHFLDRRRHDIGSVSGSEPHSRDGALDTPTLLSSRFTAPYFHDGRFSTLAEVNAWFNETFDLGLSEGQLADLTAYVETIGDGIDAYEDTIFTLEAEMEEFSFFLSTYEFLRNRGKSEVIAKTLETIALEIRAHKWDVRDASYLPLLEQLAGLMDEALAAQLKGDQPTVDARVAEYRQLYRDNAEHLR